MIRATSLFACAALLALLWPEGAGAQQSRRREIIRDAALSFRPPVNSWPNQRPVNDGWQLGVHADNTSTGMLITSVERGSAAARGGLERGDRILAVGTERVGFVGNHSVPVRKVLRRQADFQGDVLLLVQRRNRGLINMSIRLDRIGGTQFFSN
jgi:hypothetical protein